MGTWEEKDDEVGVAPGSADARLRPGLGWDEPGRKLVEVLGVWVGERRDIGEGSRGGKWDGGRVTEGGDQAGELTHNSLGTRPLRTHSGQQDTQQKNSRDSSREDRTETTMDTTNDDD